MLETIPFYLVLSLKILALGLFFDTLELIKKHKLYGREGIFPYHIHEHYQNIDSRLITMVPLLTRYPNFIFIMGLRLLLSLAVVFFIHRTGNALTITVTSLLVLQLLFNLRNRINLSGADQFITILLFSYTILLFELSYFISLLFIGFVVVHQFVAYFFTGYHKLRSPLWRNGAGILLALNSEGFGNESIALFLRKSKQVRLFFAWSAILFQLFFPVLIFSHPYCTIFFLAAGLSFHFSVSLVMNLNNFFWAFTSTYPILYFISFSLWGYSL